MLFQHLGWTLLHSLWIITILAGVYFLLHRCIPLRWARVRYALGYAILLAMVALPVVASFGINLNDFVQSRARQEAVVAGAPLPDGRGSDLFLTNVPVEAEPGGNPELRRQLVGELKKILGMADSGQRVADSEQQEIEDAALAPEILLPASYTSLPASSSLLPTPHFPLPTFLTLLSTAWAIGVVVMSLRLLRDYFAVQALGRTAKPIGGGEWFETLRELRKRLGVRQIVRLAESLQIDSPILIGMFKPVILLPLSLRTGFTPQEIEAILAHELAHVRRYDYLANLVQLLIETLLFYHPLVGWVSRSVRCDREYVCDDFVVHRTKTDRLFYAKTLTHLEQTRHSHYGESEMKNLLSTPAAAAKPLLTRIQRILELKTTERSALWPAGLILLTTLAVGAVLLTGWTPATGGKPQLPTDGQEEVLAAAPTAEAVGEGQTKLAPMMDAPMGMRAPQQSSDSNRPVIRGYSLVRIAELLGVSGMVDSGHSGGLASPNRSNLVAIMQLFQEQLNRVYSKEMVTVQLVYAYGEVSAILVIGSEKAQQSVKELLAELEKACEEIRGTVDNEQSVILQHQANSQQQQVSEFRPYQPAVETELYRKPVDSFEPVNVPEPLTASPFSSAPSPQPSPAYQPDPSWAKIRRTEAALSRVLEEDGIVEIEPLAAVVERFSDLPELKGLYFEFAEDELAETEASPKTSIKQTVPLKGISGETLLNRLLRPLGLDYCLNLDGDVIITSKTAATEYPAHRLTRIYKFNPSVPEAKNPQLLASMLEQNMDGLNVSFVPGIPVLSINASYANQKQAERIIDAAFGKGAGDEAQPPKEPGM